ncbi:MAG: radical SAM protein [Desulfobacterales bacterium]|nr:radical SAM protein [Desulfobacterales bacterium]
MMNIKPHDNRPVLTPCTLEGRNYQIDPYIGCEHYCYYCYALNQAKTDWRKEIRMHKDITSQLESELEGIEPQTIYMGWQTDPYQPCEAEYRQTRQVLELLLEKGFSASILTKSDLVLRDMDLLQKMGAAGVSCSVAFNDNHTRRLFEANTVDTERRIEALHQLKTAGVRTGALLCPVIPYITDATQLVELLAPCTDLIWIYGLSIMDRSDQSWLNVQKILIREFPDLLEKIEPAIFSKKHSYWTKLREDLMTLKNDRQLILNIQL